jgi:hypothetical protein
MRMISDLKLVNELLELFKHMDWIQGTNAALPRKAGDPPWDNSCIPTDPKADALCLRGACIRVLAPEAALIATAFTMDSDASRQIPRALGFGHNIDVVEWNDDEWRTMPDVIALLLQRQREIPEEEAAREAEAEKKRLAMVEKVTAAARRSKDKQRPKGPGASQPASARWWTVSNSIETEKEHDDD